MLLRLAYLGVTNALALLRLLPMSDRDKDAEILVLRHQIMVLERQLGGDRVQFAPADRAWLAAVLHPLPRTVLHHLRLLVRPDTVLRWHRDLIARRHAAQSRPRRAGRPRTLRSIRTLVLRLARENSGWGYRRIHGELLVLGVKVAASTVWEILKDAGVDPAPERTNSTWTTFLRSQAQALIAADFFETVTLTCSRWVVRAPQFHRFLAPAAAIPDRMAPHSRRWPRASSWPHRVAQLGAEVLPRRSSTGLPPNGPQGVAGGSAAPWAGLSGCGLVEAWPAEMRLFHPSGPMGPTGAGTPIDPWTPVTVVLCQ
ncbi:helix-turn-helix domain-containing protein [Actinoplanes derwentensis]|uniref:Uncharacterized protein n=1 Tax=Actinoplanes derwentensis TaxID=113562 RepID=A0A1H2DCJ7_9ACTN|nr:helix-turn-helix domain-containing protein [Actinoplanes derwentensis]GID90404.1 hypothetical protein Ade03nite_93280 [Actinoplanes derwentensis]SDT80478.1 hypothetical protein SAMN04489716_9220 [Actinoplanes derwentensis]